MVSNKVTAYIISIALFMEALDTTIINTAIPAMAHSLAVNPVDLKIALISYLLSLAILIPISGWIADKFGAKRVFIAALFIFTVSSLACGFSKTLLQLIISRTFQGIGGSFMFPVGRLIIVRLFPRHQLVTVMSSIIMVAALGLMLGPVLGGFITHYFSWHWIFWINIPIGIIAISMVLYWMQPSAPVPVHPLDKLGFLLFGGGLATLTFGLSAFSETTLPANSALFIISTSLALLTGYFLHSRNAAFPIVNTKLFEERTFLISVLGNIFARLGFGGVPFLLPLLLQVGIGYPAQISGMLLAPLAVGVIFVKPFALSILRLLGYKKFLIINTILLSFSLWAFTLIDANTSLFLIGSLTFFAGFLISLQYSGMNSIAYADIDSTILSSATSIMNTLQQLSQSFGVAIAALFVTFFSHTSLSIAVFHHSFIAMGIITLCSTLIFTFLRATDGHQMIENPN